MSSLLSVPAACPLSYFVSDQSIRRWFTGTVRCDPRRSLLTLELEPARLSPEQSEPAGWGPRNPTIVARRISQVPALETLEIDGE